MESQSSYRVVEGEVLPPSPQFKLSRALREVAAKGDFNPSDMQALLSDYVAEADPDGGRAMVAAIGGALGSRYRWLGAGAGAGLAALVYDFLQGLRRR